MSRLALVSILALGCGSTEGHGGPASDASIDSVPAADASPGTGTLEVTGVFVVENPANGASGGELHVRCEVQVQKNGEPVANAVVNVNPAPPSFQTILIASDSDPARYTGSYLSYQQTARIRVLAGDDFLAEVVLLGPLLHQIEEPARDAALDGTAGLHVVWSRPEGALPRVDVATLHAQLAGVEDTGSADLDAASFSAGPDEVKVTRWRRDDLGPGAAASSYIDFGVRSAQPFVVD